MTTNHHAIDLSGFSRGQLKQLADDVNVELEVRETEDRLALEEKLRSLAKEAGFDPNAVRFAGTGKRKARKHQQTNGADDE